ncbi:MAG: hypothetical protein ACUVT2_11050 [Thiobacillaceae bacterium]
MRIDKREGHDLAGPCIACKSSDAFRLHSESGVAYCYSCGGKWSPFQLAERVLGDREAAKALMVNLGLFDPPSQAGQGRSTAPSDPVAAIAKAKGVAAKSLRVFGAKAIGPYTVRLPAYGPDGKPCTHFDLSVRGKGKFAPGKPAGLFFPHRDGEVRLPQPGETWHLVEGPKDAAALHELDLLACGLNTCRLAAKFARLFRGVRVILIPDRDTAGTEGAQHSARALRHVASDVRLAVLPAEHKESDGEDVRDILRRPDGRQLVLQAITDATPVWTPDAEQVACSLHSKAAEAGDSVLSPSPVYKATPSGTIREKMTGHGPVPVPLANFTASIVAEEVRDDGAERHVVFTVTGRIGDEDLPAVTVPAERFAALKWATEAWGNRAIVYAGQGNQDHMRTAIQLLSGDVPRRVVYEHLGWRHIEGRWLYLHAGGAIDQSGAINGVTVEPAEALRRAVLPEPPQGEALRDAVRASLHLLDVAPRRLTVPLLAACYRAPLAELLAADFSLFYAGATGVKKTSLTALAQAHYGAAFDDRNLPAGWEATGNSLERLAFIAKDAVLVIDDFAPKGTTSDVQRLYREADRVLRVQGNHSGRIRMRPDGGLRAAYTPRGLIMSSGEDVPAGQSLRARLFILEVTPDDVDLAALSRAQQDAANGLFAASMAGYVRWLAVHLDTLREALRTRKLALREEVRREDWPHDRTPDMLANLALGWEQFLAYAAEAGAISAAERQRLWAAGVEAMAEAAREQAGHQASEEPTARFLELLSAAIASGRAHVADAATGAAPEDTQRWGWRLEREKWQAQGECVGWVDGEYLLLEPNAAFAAAQRLAREQGTSLPITPRTLWKRMAERGLTLTEQDRRQTYYLPRRTVAGQRRRVVVLLQNLAPPISQNMANMANTANPLIHKDFGAQKVAISGGRIWPESHENMATDPGVAIKHGQAAILAKQYGHETEPESLAPQASGHVGHIGHEIADSTPLGFSRDGDVGEESAGGGTTGEEVDGPWLSLD